MDENRKFTDSLTMIEVDIEKAIMANDLNLARQELAKLVERAPQHPRRDFLQASIDRAAELTRLAAQKSSSDESAGNAEVERAASRPRATESRRSAARETARETVAGRPPATTRRTARTAPNDARSYGAPINDAPLQRSIPLDAPINAEPVLAASRPGNSFGGRTIEASDSSAGAGAPAAATASVPAAENPAGSAAVTLPPAGPAAPVVPAAVDVKPARILKRVAPVAPTSVSARAGGFVVVKYTIAENGRVTDVEVLESSPTGVFDGAAQTAVRKWTFEPRQENGVAVASSAKARLVFEPAD